MNIEETITVTKAAELKGVTRQAIFYAVKAGDIRVLGMYGSSKMLSRADVEKYKPRQKHTTAAAGTGEQGEGAGRT